MWIKIKRGLKLSVDNSFVKRLVYLSQLFIAPTHSETGLNILIIMAFITAHYFIIIMAHYYGFQCITALECRIELNWSERILFDIQLIK